MKLINKMMNRESEVYYYLTHEDFEDYFKIYVICENELKYFLINSSKLFNEFDIEPEQEEELFYKDYYDYDLNAVYQIKSNEIVYKYNFDKINKLELHEFIQHYFKYNGESETILLTDDDYNIVSLIYKTFDFINSIYNLNQSKFVIDIYNEFEFQIDYKLSNLMKILINKSELTFLGKKILFKK